jgi:DNA-binding transcriptional LysR family regulator
VQLPTMFVREQIADASLVRLLPDWSLAPEVIHAVFASHRGLKSSVPALIDHLVEGFRALQVE